MTTTTEMPAAAAAAVEAAAPAAEPVTVAPAEAAAPAAERPARTTTVYGETAELEAAAYAALQAFAAEGLELPVLELSVNESAEPCRRPDGTDRAGVTVIHGDRYEVLSCGSRFTLMHELAHAWDHHALDDAVRAAFLELRGLESWSHEVWGEAGGEHAASVVAWAFTGVRPAMVGPADDLALAKAYELLTGRSAPALSERGLELVDGRLRRVPGLPPSAVTSAAHESDARSAHVPG